MDGSIARTLNVKEGGAEHGKGADQAWGEELTRYQTSVFSKSVKQPYICTVEILTNTNTPNCSLTKKLCTGLVWVQWLDLLHVLSDHVQPMLWTLFAVELGRDGLLHLTTTKTQSEIERMLRGRIYTPDTAVQYFPGFAQIQCKRQIILWKVMLCVSFLYLQSGQVDGVLSTVL